MNKIVAVRHGNIAFNKLCTGDTVTVYVINIFLHVYMLTVFTTGEISHRDFS